MNPIFFMNLNLTKRVNLETNTNNIQILLMFFHYYTNNNIGSVFDHFFPELALDLQLNTA